MTAGVRWVRATVDTSLPDGDCSRGSASRVPGSRPSVIPGTLPPGPAHVRPLPPGPFVLRAPALRILVSHASRRYAFVQSLHTNDDDRHVGPFNGRWRGFSVILRSHPQLLTPAGSAHLGRRASRTLTAIAWNCFRPERAASYRGSGSSARTSSAARSRFAGSVTRVSSALVLKMGEGR